MSKRKEHLFQFTASSIADAAETEETYHRERAGWWNAEYEKACAEAKSRGVEVRHFPVTGGNRAQIVIDVTLQGRIDEASRKRTEHQQRADRFAMEARAYGSQLRQTTYDLDSDDVAYFRLAGGEREESSHFAG